MTGSPSVAYLLPFRQSSIHLTAFAVDADPYSRCREHARTVSQACPHQWKAAIGAHPAAPTTFLLSRLKNLIY
jgi:hypothetical protein